MGSLVVFQSARVVISREFLSLIPSNVNKKSFLRKVSKELKLTADLKVATKPALEGQWENILQVQEKLSDYILKWQKKDVMQKDVMLQTSDVASLAIQGGDEVLTGNGGFEPAREIDPKLIAENKTSDGNVNINLVKHEDLYMDIVVANGTVDTVSSTAIQLQCTIPDDLGGPREEKHPLNKLCQLLGIDKEAEPICEEVNVPLNSVERKRAINEKKRKYEQNLTYKHFCGLCSFKSKRESQFLKHLDVHKKYQATFSCDRCDFKTVRAGVLRRHRLTHSSGESLITCLYCPYKTDEHDLMAKHLHNKHPPEQRGLECKKCNFICGSLRQLKVHYTVEHCLHVEKLFKCTKCPYKTGTTGHLTRHWNDVHGNKRPFLCHCCGKSFKRHDTLKQHRMIHGDSVHSCLQCGKSCKSASQLREHMSVHSSQRPFLCEQCGAMFKSRSSQVRHIRLLHTTTKPVQCPDCKRALSSKDVLSRHQKNHHHRRPQNISEENSEVGKTYESNATE